jgi:hypothetical protein
VAIFVTFQILFEKKWGGKKEEAYFSVKCVCWAKHSQLLQSQKKMEEKKNWLWQATRNTKYHLSFLKGNMKVFLMPKICVEGSESICEFRGHDQVQFWGFQCVWLNTNNLRTTWTKSTHTHHRASSRTTWRKVSRFDLWYKISSRVCDWLVSPYLWSKFVGIMGICMPQKLHTRNWQIKKTLQK